MHGIVLIRFFFKLSFYNIYTLECKLMENLSNVHHRLQFEAHASAFASNKWLVCFPQIGFQPFTSFICTGAFQRFGIEMKIYGISD